MNAEEEKKRKKEEKKKIQTESAQLSAFLVQLEWSQNKDHSSDPWFEFMFMFAVIENDASKKDFLQINQRRQRPQLGGNGPEEFILAENSDAKGK